MNTAKSKGFIIFAKNNGSINYLKIALTNALLIKKYLDKPVTVVTDARSLAWEDNKNISDLINKTFDKIILLEKQTSVSNPRAYRNTIYNSVIDNFDNSAISSAYDLSPYEETILIDSDYLVFDTTLNNLWGCSEAIRINKDAINLDGQLLTGSEHRLSDTGIRMYWATCTYFKKCEMTKLLFETVKHISEHWAYYQLAYGFGGGLYRNDFAFSIAIHMMCGFEENDDIKPLPTRAILTVLDSDQAHRYDGNGEFLFFVNNKIENWKFELARLKGISVHVLNKISLIPLLDSIIEDVS